MLTVVEKETRKEELARMIGEQIARELKEQLIPALAPVIAEAKERARVQSITESCKPRAAAEAAAAGRRARITGLNDAAVQRVVETTYEQVLALEVGRALEPAATTTTSDVPPLVSNAGVVRGYLTDDELRARDAHAASKIPGTEAVMADARAQLADGMATLEDKARAWAAERERRMTEWRANQARAAELRKGFVGLG